MATKKITNKVALLDELKREREEIDEQIKEVQQEIISELDRIQEKTIVVEIDERKVKATKVEGIRTTIDENTLKKSLGEKLWVKVSSRVLDKKKLEAHIASGEVDPIVVAESSTEKANAPYVKLT